MADFNPRVYGDLFEIRSGLVFRDDLVSESKFEAVDGVANGSGYVFSGLGCYLDQSTYLSYDDVRFCRCIYL